MERLKLNPHEHFIDCIDRVTLDWAGSVKDRVEVHSLDGTPTPTSHRSTWLHYPL
jgi:hypothetical protein